MNLKELYKGKKVVIATNHGKESVIAPVFRSAFQMESILPENLITDRFGTFSGEVERMDTALQTARLKCKEALAHSDAQICIASEGSFGPSPLFPFVPIDEECLVLIDTELGLEFSSNYSSYNTNFNKAKIFNLEQLERFCDLAKFPTHGLIIKEGDEPGAKIHKGITSKKNLLTLAKRLLKSQAFFWLETDMRAMYNPSRMKVIGTAARMLALKMQQNCPECGHPGIWENGFVQGLPCSECHQPTLSPKAILIHCNHCQFSYEKPISKSKKFESPQYCEICNP